MTDNNQNTENGNKADKSKRNLITEKITGRRLTPARLLRNLILALLMGVVFGAAAAVVFCGVMNVRESIGTGIDFGETVSVTSETDAPGEVNESIPEPVTAETSEEEPEVPDTESDPEGKDETVGSQESMTGETPEAEKTEPEAPAETESETLADEGNGWDIREEFLPDASSYLQQCIEETEKSLVRVSATSTAESWFAGEVSNTETFAGVIIDVGEEEILILTADDVAGQESLRAELFNGVTVDTYIKSISESDGLAVLAVSSVNGIDGEMLKDIPAIEFAGEEGIRAGEAVIAVGSPLGVFKSYSFGNIGFVNNPEPGYDVSETVFYADVDAEAGRGTFIIDYAGKMLGVASDTGAGAIRGGYARIVSLISLEDTISAMEDGTDISYAGIKASDTTFEMRYSGVPEGCFVTDVDVSGPAYTAGIKRGDIITGVNGESVGSVEEYTRALRETSPGSSIKVQASRPSGGSYREMTFDIEAAKR